MFAAAPGMQQNTRTAPLFAAGAGNAAVGAAAAGVGQAAVSAAMAAAAAAQQPTGGWGGVAGRGGMQQQQQQQQVEEMPSELRIAAARAEKQKRMEVRKLKLLSSQTTAVSAMYYHIQHIHGRDVV
jgi:hypothetical protein